MSESLLDSTERQARAIDWLLGEAGRDEARELQRECAEDAGFARDTAELRGLFADLRELGSEVDIGASRVVLAVRHNIERRAELRQRRPVLSLQGTLVLSLKVVAVAAACLGSLLIGERWLSGSGWVGDSVARDRFAEILAQLPERLPPVGATPDAEPLVAEQQAQERSTTAWLMAINDLANLRREFKNRFNPSLRHRAIRAAGGNLGLEMRIETLADEIAAKIDAGLTAAAAGEVLPVQDVALALRALLAAGSSKRIGPHQAVVRRCSDHLEGRIAGLEGGELATALSGLMDVAVVYGGQLAREVKAHTSRMILGVIEPRNTRGVQQVRPPLLSWHTSVSELADAGQVLRLAAAFGVDAAQAVRVRSYVSQHLAERIAQTRDERPDLLAAQLYGFAELVDCASLEKRLRLWRARDLVPEHFVALHHVSWSRFPLRSGWADFQQDLRRVAAARTPETAGNASALLLSLAVNYAAPGCQELLDLDATR